jgi:hypothetical protein
VTQKDGKWFCFYCSPKDPAKEQQGAQWSCPKCQTSAGPAKCRNAGNPHHTCTAYCSNPKPAKASEKEWSERPAIERKLYNEDGTLKKRGAELTDDEAFRAAFDRSNPAFHGNTEGAQAKVIQTGGWQGQGRAPPGMEAHADWMSLPERVRERDLFVLLYLSLWLWSVVVFLFLTHSIPCFFQEAAPAPTFFGEEYEKVKTDREQLNALKQAMSAIDPSNAAIVKHAGLVKKYKDDEEKSAKLERYVCCISCFPVFLPLDGVLRLCFRPAMIMSSTPAFSGS